MTNLGVGYESNAWMGGHIHIYAAFLRRWVAFLLRYSNTSLYHPLPQLRDYIILIQNLLIKEQIMSIYFITSTAQSRHYKGANANNLRPNANNTIPYAHAMPNGFPAFPQSRASLCYPPKAVYKKRTNTTQVSQTKNHQPSSTRQPRRRIRSMSKMMRRL
jgi:hypothetical protein